MTASQQDLVKFLESLPQSEPEISRQTAQDSIRCWLEVQAAVHEIGLPVAQPTEDGCVQLAWRTGRHILTVEVGGEQWDWFSRDPEGEFWGVASVPGVPVPPQVIEALGHHAGHQQQRLD